MTASNSTMARRRSARKAEREAKGLILTEDKRKRQAALKPLATGAMLRTFGQTKTWNRLLLRRQKGGDAMGAYLATLLGAHR